ncbi:MAG: O-antigen ligase family protein [Bdellovibrionales bacterium]
MSGHKLGSLFTFNLVRPLWIPAFSLLLVLLPLPFGTNRPWSSDLFAVLCGALLAAMLWTERQQDLFTGNLPVKRIWTSTILISIVIVWSFLQIVPWTPTSWHHPIWQEASALLGKVGGSISIDPGVFPETLVRFVSYIVCFILALAIGRDTHHARHLVKALAFAGFGYALYGILAQSAGSDTILWYKKWAYQGFLTSTFVNKNSYALYAGLGFLCCCAFLFHHFKNFSHLDRVLAHQSKVAAILASLRLRDYFYLLFPVLFLAALAMTGSRAGIASTLIGAIAFLAAFAINKKWQMHQWVSFIIIAAILFLSFVGMGGDALLLRVDSQAINDDTAMRMAAYDLSVQAIQDNPWLGFGLGTFNTAFKLYRDESLPIWFHHAHNDYLEMIMDLGLPVALCLFAAIALMVSCAVTGILHRRRDGIYPALAIGASVMVGIHSCVDFSLHIPAIAATYAAILGRGVAQSCSSKVTAEISSKWKETGSSAHKTAAIKAKGKSSRSTPKKDKGKTA